MLPVRVNPLLIGRRFGRCQTASGRRSVAFLALLAPIFLGCGEGTREPHPLTQICDRGEVADFNASASGTFGYFSDFYHLRGAISLEQADTLVRVLETTYDNANDRSLVGEAELEGNRLSVQLVPENGDTDYSADVTFLFDEEANAFCVSSFSDTNGDVNSPGRYYLGQRR